MKLFPFPTNWMSTEQMMNLERRIQESGSSKTLFGLWNVCVIVYFYDILLCRTAVLITDALSFVFIPTTKKRPMSYEAYIIL